MFLLHHVGLRTTSSPTWCCEPAEHEARLTETGMFQHDSFTACAQPSEALQGQKTPGCFKCKVVRICSMPQAFYTLNPKP